MYPWHPWYGRTVVVIQSVTKGGQHLLRCTLDGEAVDRLREIPAWMVDRVSCCLMQLAPLPSVGVDDLRRLRQLLHDAAGKAEPIMDQHASPNSQGDADAPNSPTDLAAAARPVCPLSDQADLGSPTASREAKRPRAARRTASQPAPSAGSTRTSKGGRR